MERLHYAAFISYAHADEAVAARLHKDLETYKPPKVLKTERAMSPIFRDVAELTAHHDLSEKIRDAVKGSRYLIVLCSPAAKASHWVNEEIRLFRGLHGEAAILCAIVDGTPETAFPPALTEGGREPLAGNLSGGKEGYRFGVTQLAASMLGVGLDALVQRDAQRRRRRLQIITAASLGFAAIMGGMAWTAVDARGEAEASRTEAEKLVEYMVKDLKRDLEPLGKLQILDQLGEQVITYYDGIPIADMNDDRLARQARARHILGQVALDQEIFEKAEHENKVAYDLTKEILRRNPSNTDAIFAHAQSEYWMGTMYRGVGENDEVLPYYQEYDRLGKILHSLDPENKDWAMEAAWGTNNLGLAFMGVKHYDEALIQYTAAVSVFEGLMRHHPDDIQIVIEYGNSLAGKSDALMALNRKQEAYETRLSHVTLLNVISNTYPDNVSLKIRKIQGELKLSHFIGRSKGSCEINRSTDALKDLENLFSRDQTNKNWRYDFAYYWVEFLQLCRKDISEVKFNDYVSELKNFVRVNFPNGEFSQRVDELTMFQVNSK